MSRKDGSGLILYPNRKAMIPPILAFCFLSLLGAPEYALGQADLKAGPNDYVKVKAVYIEHSNVLKKTWAREGVVIEYMGMAVEGGEGQIDHNTGEGFLSGEVYLDEEEARISATRAEFNINTGDGTLYNAHGRIGPRFYFSGVKIDRKGEDHFIIKDGSCSTCPFPDQDWRLEISLADVTLERYAFVKGVTFRAGGVPVLYLPYFFFPVKTKRATGFLIPEAGYSEKNGFNMKNWFFWAMAENMDATISHDHRGGESEGFGLEYRYILSPTAMGRFWGEYYIPTEAPPPGEEKQDLWRALFDHSQLLPFGAQNLIKLDMESKNSIARRWEEDLLARSRRYSDSYFLVRKNWDTRSLDFQVRRRSSVMPGVDETVDQLPAIYFINQKQALGDLPVYWFLDSSYTEFKTYFDDENKPDEEAVEFDTNRMDFSPGVSMVLSPAPWISLEPEVRYRTTLYSNGVGEDGFELNESFLRDYYTASALLTGPRIYRIFQPDGPVAVKHLIVPKISWSYTPEYEQYDGEDRRKVWLIDGIDNSRPLHLVTFSLTNQALFKQTGPKGDVSINERMKFVIEAGYDLLEADREETPQNPLRPMTPVGFDLDTRLTESFMLNIYGAYDTYESSWASSHVELGFKKKGVFNFALDRAAEYDNETWNTAFLELFLPFNTILDLSGVFNETQGFVNDGAIRLKHHRGCWGFGVSALYHKSVLSDTGEENQFKEELKIMFSINLLGVGDTIGEIAEPLAGRKI